MEGLALLLNTFNPLSSLVRLLLAAICGGLVGMERGRHGRAAGLRTHSLVCLGAALAAQVGFFATETLGYASDPLRVGAQVISGIGFLGVGTILIKGRFQITGLTTAACVWATATIGLALGVGFYEGAFLGFAASFLTITILHRLEYKLGKQQLRYGIYVEINTQNEIRTAINLLEKEYGASGVQVTTARSGLVGNVGIEANINNVKHQLPIELIDIDHDAGDYANDGGDYIKLLDLLEETGRSYPIRIHSMNPVGRENMLAIIRRNGWTEVR
jgi:putative Mg2+ transporter-C (MgtC) family protein